MKEPEESSIVTIRSYCRWSLTALFVLILVGAAIPMPTNAQAVTTVDVDITPNASVKVDDAFSPNPLDISVGDTVVWTNKDTTPHTVTSGNASSGADGQFDSLILAPQATFSFTFNQTGSFPYYCMLHPNMVGTVIVGVANGPVLAILDVPRHITKNQDFNFSIHDNDLNADENGVDEYTFHINAGDSTSSKVLAPGKAMLEIRVNGQPVILNNTLDIELGETGPETGLIAPDPDFNTMMLMSSTRVVQDMDVIDFIYTDLSVDPHENVTATAVVGLWNRTSLVLNPVESVTAGSNITFSGTLYDLETSKELPGKQISITGNTITGVLSGTTAGIRFEDPNMQLKSCSTELNLPPSTTDGSDTPDDLSDDKYPNCLPDRMGDTGFNNVLHLGIGGKIILPPGNKVVTLELQDMGTSQVTFDVTEDTTPERSFEYVAFGYCPDAVNVNLVSKVGIKQIEISNITTDTSASSPISQCNTVTDATVGISQIKTFDTDGDPSERYAIDFEDLALGSLHSPLELSIGSFFITTKAPTQVATQLRVQAGFSGDSDYLPITSSPQRFATITPTINTALGIGGEPTTGPVEDTGTGITTISCITDSDRDGLCNTWESGTGIPYKEGTITRYYSLPSGLDPNNEDILVEIDYMQDDASNSHLPSTTALDKVVSAFSDRGINLKYFIGEPIPHTNALNTWSDTDADDTNDFYSIKQKWFGTSTEHGTQLLRNNNKAMAKAQAFHYALFAHSIGTCPRDTDPNGAGTPSGLAEINGNDFIVSLGCGFGPYDANGNPDPNRHDIGTDDEQAGTFMHELGHNLDLDHGGPREFVTLPLGYSVQPPLATADRQTYAITDNVVVGSDGTRAFTIKGPASTGNKLSILTTGPSTGTLVITVIVNFVDNSNIAVDPGIVSVGTVTATVPGSNILVSPSNGIIPSVSAHSGGNVDKREINLKIRFTTTAATDATTGNLGTFTIPLTITNFNAKIKAMGNLNTPDFSPHLLIDVPSVDYTMNCKPEYPSVMSYSQQFPDLYKNTGFTWQPTYSNWTGADLNENALVESAGLTGNKNYIVFNDGTANKVKGIPTSPIDWKVGSTGTVQSDINYLSIVGCGLDGAGNPLPHTYQVLKGFDDWNNIRYNFREGLGAIDGVYPANTASLYLREGPKVVLPPIEPPEDDNDNDSYKLGGGDCDDNNPKVHPGAPEIPGNDIDDNCNGQIDERTFPPNDDWLRFSIMWVVIAIIYGALVARVQVQYQRR